MATVASRRNDRDEFIGWRAQHGHPTASFACLRPLVTSSVERLLDTTGTDSASPINNWQLTVDLRVQNRQEDHYHA